MNILDIVDNSTILKRLYPNGLLRFSVGSIALSHDRITLVLHEETIPAIQVEKWGVWGKDYHIITFELIGSPLHKTTVKNWQTTEKM